MKSWIQRHQTELLLFAAALLWFLPGVWWGLPSTDADSFVRSWAPDELGPWGAVHAARRIVDSRPNGLTPQYPLAHFFVQGLFVWPYYIATLLADNVGLPPMEPALTTLTILHRIPSLLMAAGSVVAARAFGRRLGGNPAGWFAALAVLVTGPLVFYARTSNVDAAGLFWSAVALVVAFGAIRDGFTIRRGVVLGWCAGIGTATKDQQYAFFLGLGVVVLVAHWLDRDRTPEGRSTWWRAPAAALGVAAGSYLLLSGVLLLPKWFVEHVQFIKGGDKQQASEHIRVLRGSYYAHPASAAGYWAVAKSFTDQLLAAIGWPLALLAAAGAALLARRDRRLLLLLLVPSVVFVVGVIGPVRFVRPRFLLSVDFVACMLAAVAFLEGWRRAGAARVVVAIAAVAGIGLGAARGLDLTQQMLNDGRHEAAQWLERNVQLGDTVAYFGAPLKLPRLPRGTVLTPAVGQLVGDIPPLTRRPKFIISIPQQPVEPVHEWSVPDSVFHALIDGSAGYRQVYAVQRAAWWPRPLLVASYVNSPIRIFMREDLVATLAAPPRIELANP